MGSGRAATTRLQSEWEVTVGVRVRKLAKELRRTPAEVLGALHALGFERYKTSQDMVSDSIVAKVRRELRTGREVVPVAPRDGKPRVAASSASRSDDLMSQLVPGVVKAARPSQRQQGAVVESRARRDAGAQAVTASSPAPEPESGAGNDAMRAISRARERLEQTRSHLRDDREALEAARVRLAAEESEFRERMVLEQAALDAEREALEAERGALEARWTELSEQERWLEARKGRIDALKVTTDEREAASRAEAKDVERARQALGPTLGAMLEARGLRGRDESERALAALARVHLLRDLLPFLRVSNADALGALLRRHLVLVGGGASDAPEGSATVVVAPERAEIPAGTELDALMRRVGERLLLNGLRRVVFVNVPPRWQKQIADRLDARVESRFRSSGVLRDRQAAEGDVTRTDAVVLVDVACSPEADDVYATGRATVLRLEAQSLGALLAGLRDGLSAL